ncbi:MAG: ATP-dependent DNA helicase RecG [Nitrospirae bacterium]|nr:ATP-dependent DNA helicase RecG [Nitrospirota bacterium]
MGYDLASPIQYVKGVGPQRARYLARLEINNVRDALFHLPYRYEDRSSLIKISQLAAALADARMITVAGKVLSAEVVTPNPRGPRRGGLRIFELLLNDGSGSLRAKWFNQAYLKKHFKPGQDVVLYGVVKNNYWGTGLEMTNPEYEIMDDGDDDTTHPSSDQIHTGRIVPVYHLTEGISQKQLRSVMYTIISSVVSSVRDTMPHEIISRYHLPGLSESMANVHFPGPGIALDSLNSGSSPYHERLSFDELFTFQAGLAIIKKGEVLEKGISFHPNGSLADRLRADLPYTLTGAQERVLSDILNDMRSPVPMNRLIQGDVGSGKTIVALLAMLAAVESGYQAALMAPTELLSEQHYMNIHPLVEKLGLKIQLLTGSKKNKNIETISSGDANIVVGTHALIQESISFKNLGLIVIDEQHRFGVMQRATLRKKGVNPDTLIMTATPIPRTLALTLYGDLDYSVIDELPPNRSPVITRQLSEKQKEYIYQLMDEQVKKGSQTYIVYPVIEESDKTTLKAAITGMEALKAKFPQYNIGLLHGRMKPAEREEVMREFKKGSLHILVATTVIEVGVDVPNATLMVIIHAERFGLAQLHQLRGRVGRGSGQSHCILLNYGAAEDAAKRLAVMVRTNDGFKIAEEDLAIRGPGEFFGTKQSGLPDLKVANIVRDAKLLEVARKEAFALIEKDTQLQNYPELRRSIEDFWGMKLDLFKTA